MNTSVLTITIGMILSCAMTAIGQTNALLDQHVGAIDLRQRTVASAIDALSQGNGIRIAVGWDGLGADEFRQGNLNLSFSGCRVRDVLRAIFPVAEIYEEAGAVHVVAKDSAPATVKAYAVLDILRIIGPDDLANLVESAVRSDDGVENGGHFELRMQGGMLVVTQTAAGHEEVFRLLEVLRDAIRIRNNPFAPMPAPTGDITRRRLGDLRFQQTPLDVAILDLLTTWHVPYVIHWDTLEAAGLGGTRLTLDLSGRTLGEAMDVVSELTGLQFMLHDGIVELTSPDTAARTVETRVFDVRPMVQVVKDFVSASPSWHATVNAEAVTSAISTLIEGQVDTDSWKDNGGPAGAIREAGDLLVVTNTAHAHEQIAAMMSDIQAASQPASQPAPPPQKPDPLDKRTDQLDLRDTDLSDALDRLGQRTETQILVDWKSLESVGVDHNTPISVKLTGGSLRSGLDVVLELAGRGDARLGYRVDDAGIVHVGSADSVGHMGITRIYNIRDLIGRYVDYHNVSQNVPDRQQAARIDAVDAITKIIEDTVDTDSWKDNGGSLGALREFAGLLIVTNTPQAHTKIKAFLDSLRTQATLWVAPKQ